MSWQTILCPPKLLNSGTFLYKMLLLVCCRFVTIVISVQYQASVSPS